MFTANDECTVLKCLLKRRCLPISDAAKVVRRPLPVPPLAFHEVDTQAAVERGDLRAVNWLNSAWMPQDLATKMKARSDAGAAGLELKVLKEKKR